MGSNPSTVEIIRQDACRSTARAVLYCTVHTVLYSTGTVLFVQYSTVQFGHFWLPNDHVKVEIIQFWVGKRQILQKED